jgi:dimethylpropiothetin dethiomethylase
MDASLDIPRPPPPPRLSDRPDWGYLLREFQELYRRRSSGGSKPIGLHMRAVREAIGKVLADNPPVIAQAPQSKPVVAHLARALDNGRGQVTAQVVRTLEHLAPELSWQYGYEKVPKALGRSYAYAEISGPHGPVVTDRVILGLVLFGPRCTYPAHAHDGLTESYITLSGSVSENDEGVFAPGSLIFNPPGRMHRITTADQEPSLLAYAWHGTSDKLTHQKMEFRRARRAAEIAKDRS